MGTTIGLMRWLCGEFVDDPEAPEGIELYNWIPVSRDWNSEQGIDVVPPCPIVCLAPHEPGDCIETVIELETVRVHQMQGIRVGDDVYWIGWDETERLVVAWIL